jgi:hypothetical protein
MTENIIETIRKGVQDFVAPEVRELKGDIRALGAKIRCSSRRVQRFIFGVQRLTFRVRFTPLGKPLKSAGTNGGPAERRFARRDGNAARN